MANRYKVIQGGPYPHFVTNSVEYWFPIFISGRYCRIITDSLKYIQANRGLRIHCYVIMPTHIHLIVTAEGDDLSAIMRDFKKFTSRAIYKAALEEGHVLATRVFEYAARNNNMIDFKVWQNEFHPKILSTREMLYQKVEYIHLNPVRKELVGSPEDWHFSSAGFYAGESCEDIQIDVLEW